MDRIRAALAMQLDGDRSSSLADMRKDLNAAAALERAAIADLKGQASTPVSLPAIEELTQRVTSLADLLSRSSCAGAQLDFPAQQFQGVGVVWVPFEHAIMFGWR